jgi:hypothetical protein
MAFHQNDQIQFIYFEIENSWKHTLVRDFAFQRLTGKWQMISPIRPFQN